MNTRFAFSVVALLAIASTSLAISPPLPGMTSGIGDQGMKHIGVGMSGTALFIHYDPVPPSPAVPLTMMSGHGIDYDPDKFNVLEDVYYNAQYGWNPYGLIGLPSNLSIWIERTGVTQPAGSTFMVYEAGMGSEMAIWTMNELYAANGDKWQWDGAMQHDFYTADLLGSYTMSFNVYVGDAAGVPDAGYTPTSTTLEFTVVPEPATIGLTALAAACLFMRRR